MNAPEKHVVRLAVFLFVLGVVVRILPWGLPSIETFQVGEPLITDKVTESQAFPLESAPVQKEAFSGEPSLKESNFSKKSPKKQKKGSLPVHINSASVDELCALKGVGPKLAEKIISVREASGPFKSGADLEKVPGIGKKKLSGLLLGVIFD
jgi:competence protein ComEA